MHPAQSFDINLHKRERNVLFNEALNTFLSTVIWRQTWLRTILIVRKENPLLPHRLLFPINASFICIIPDRITHTTAFVTPVVEHWLEREIAQWVHPMKDRSDDPSQHERTLYLRATSSSSSQEAIFCGEVLPSTF